MTIKKAIVMYRAKHSLSMKAFAEKCGVAMQTIYNIETVGQTPSRVTRMKIEMIIGDEYPIDEEEEDDG